MPMFLVIFMRSIFQIVCSTDNPNLADLVGTPRRAQRALATIDPRRNVNLV